MTDQITNNRKIVAIVSYITWIGWIIAYVLHTSNKTALGAFHLRQTGFIYLVSIALSLISVVFAGIEGIGWIISRFVGISLLILFVLWIIGLLGAINGEEKKVPLIGDMAQNTLAGLR